MISLHKYELSADIVDRYAVIVYSFDFENSNEYDSSNELKFEITIDPDAFISNFEANIDGEIFYGQTKEKQKAKKEYNDAKKKNENAILISQPYDNIPNVFEIKTNIDSKSKVLLNITIEQYLKKKFNFNQLNVEILRNFRRYRIKQNYKYISFKLNITDLSGIYDINIPSSSMATSSSSNDIIINNKTIDKFNQNCVINGKIMDRNSSINELILKYKIKGEQNDSMVLYDNKSDRFCHIISDIITDSMIKNEIDCTEGDNDNDIKENILIPRRVVIVIDRSGSMGGTKWVKTISSTNTTLKQLRIGYDRYCIILCGNQLDLIPTDTIQLTSNLNINSSVSYLQTQQAQGCELINKALLKGIELIKNDIKLLNKNDSHNNYFMNQIIFITDGNPTIGETNTDKITLNVKQANDLRKIDKYSSKISIFSFGIGSDANDSSWVHNLNHLFLRKLSLNNNGFYKRIKQTSADTTFGEYFSILSKPVLSNIDIKYNNKNVGDLTKTKFNTLYSGNDLIICGKIDNTKYNNKDNITLNATISAITGKEIKENNKLVTKPINITKHIQVNLNLNGDTKQDDDNKENEKENNNKNNIERIWAYLKLKQFAENKLISNDMIEFDDDEKKENASEPLQLAMKYKFVTPWTSMIVVKKKKKIFETTDKEYGKLTSDIKEHKIKLVTVGDSNCGKTSLILRFVENIFNTKNNQVTMDINCKNKKLKIEDNYFNISLWDTVGQEKYSSNLAPMYLRNANGVIFVCDINNIESINNIKKWAKSINQTISFNKNNSILIVNKSDLIHGDDTNAMDVIKELTDNLGIDYVITSAKDNINVKNTYFNLIGSIYDTIFESKLSNKSNNNNNNNAWRHSAHYAHDSYSGRESMIRSTSSAMYCPPSLDIDESRSYQKKSGCC